MQSNALSDKIFVNRPPGLLITDAALGDPIKDILIALGVHSVTDAEYQILRELDLVKRGKAGYLRAIEQGVTKLRSISPNMTAIAFPGRGSAHVPPKLAQFDWSKQGSEESRLKKIEMAMKLIYNVPGIVVQKIDLNVPAWGRHFWVSPVNLCIQQGRKARDLYENPSYYGKLVDPIARYSSLNTAETFNGVMGTSALRLHDETLGSLRKLPGTQKVGKELIVYESPVNPTIWFEAEGETRSLVPLFSREILLNPPSGNTMKTVIPGDLIMVLSFLFGEDHLIDQIDRDGRATIEATGTDLWSRTAWTNAPRIYRTANSQLVGLGCSPRSADDASGRNGIFGAAIA